MEEQVVGMKMTQVEFKKVIETAERLSKIARGLSAISSTIIDDKIVNFVDTVLAFVKPFADEPLVVDVINLILGLFDKNEDPKKFLEKVKAFSELAKG